jgi:hypothetical protein
MNNLFCILVITNFSHSASFILMAWNLYFSIPDHNVSWQLHYLEILPDILFVHQTVNVNQTFKIIG